MAGLIVVGVDGSQPSRTALRWALAEAELRGATLRVVHAWRSPYDYELAGAGDLGPVADDTALANAARHVLDEALRDLEQDRPGVPIESVLREGDPVDVLCAEADGAELLVVGAHGHRGFGDALVGSVSGRVAHHCVGAIVIVPDANAARHAHRRASHAQESTERP